MSLPLPTSELEQLESVLNALEQFSYAGKAAFTREEDAAATISRLRKAHKRLGQIILDFQDE